MGLTKDFEDLIKDWKNSSTIKKIIVVVFFFLTFSSITSISDVVYEWKGFIKEGIEFYRNNISKYIIMFFNYIGLKTTQVQADTFVILTTYFGPLVRHSLIKIIESKYEEGWILWNVFLLFTYSLFTYLLVFDVEISNVTYVLIAFTLLFILTFVMGRAFTEKMLNIFFPVIVGILILLLLAGITSGLGRDFEDTTKFIKT